MKSTYKVKDAARITGVSIRTLHYYDEISLLTPSGRTDSGYRLYTDDDLLRMQQILIGRSLGFPLEEIRRWLDDPHFDYTTSLRKQRALLVEKLDETNAMIAAIDRTLDVLADRRDEIDFEGMFDGFNPTLYRDEVKARWGTSVAFEQSANRVKNYTEKDWKVIKAEADRILEDAATAMAAEVAPDSGTALEIVARHRLHNCRWYYDLSPEMHANLAGMWESDERFQRNIDKYAPGLTAWLAKAVRASVDLRNDGHC